jgi:hypothetical protein
VHLYLLLLLLLLLLLALLALLLQLGVLLEDRLEEQLQVHPEE